MTAYHGGKQRIGEQLAQRIYEITKEIEEDNNFVVKGYCEPFAGMLGVYRHIPNLFMKHKPKLVYKVGDANKSVVMMWKQAKNGWKPPTKTTESQYKKLRNGAHSALKGYIGHQYSFGGQFFSGYATKYGKKPDSTKASNLVHEIGSILKKTKTSIQHCDYTKYSKLRNHIIYCDPPYMDSYNKYKDEKINEKDFWKWCREMSNDNIVFVSNYSAPKGFERVYSSKHKLTGIGARSRSKVRTENLYVMY